MKKIDSKNLDARFKYDVAAHPGGENIKLCFACGTCTAGCPVSGVNDEFNPRKIIREVLLGMRKEVLASPLIWHCVQCYSCTAKCPQNVKFREIIKALREMAVAQGHVDSKISQDIEELAPFTQKMRKNLIDTLFSDRGEYEKKKEKLKKICE